jgi:hypothetical protein
MPWGIGRLLVGYEVIEGVCDVQVGIYGGRGGKLAVLLSALLDLLHGLGWRTNSEMAIQDV